MRVSCGRGCQMVPGTMARSRPFGRLASVCGRGITPGSLSPSPRSTGHRSSPPWSPSSLVLRLLLLLLLMFPPFYSPNYFKRDCLLHTLKLIFTSFCMCVCVDSYRQNTLVHLAKAYSAISVQTTTEALGLTQDAAVERNSPFPFLILSFLFFFSSSSFHSLASLPF